MILQKKIKKLGTNILLFMKNIKEIHYTINDVNEKYNGDGFYTLKKEKIEDKDNAFKVIASDGSNNNDNKYLIFSKGIPDTERTVDIAFSIIERDEIPNFIKTNLDKISVYFPTMTESKVNFIVQAPFDLDPNRSNLLKGSESNEKLLKILAELLKDAIFFIKDKNWLSLELINLLPYKAMGNEDDWSLYNLYKETIQLLINEPVIPCNDRTYITADKARIVRGSKLLDLFKDNLLGDFIKLKGAKWLSEKFTKDRFGELHDYFRKDLDKGGLGVKEIGHENLPQLIKNNPSFLCRVSNKWLEDFYSYLYEDVKSLLGKNGDLATVPFIKTNDGNFNAPFEDVGRGQEPKQNIYSKPKNVNLDIEGFLFIDDYIIQNCPDFVDALGLQEPDDYEYFIKELEKTKEMGNIDDNLHISQIKRALKYMKDEQQHENVVDNFKSLLKLKLINNYAVEDKKYKEDYFIISNNNIYRENDENGISIKNYFFDIPNLEIMFLNEEFYLSKEISSGDLSLLEKLGIKNNIYFGLDDNNGWIGTDGRSNCSNKDNFRKRLNLIYIDKILSFIRGKFTLKAKDKSTIILNLLKNVEKHLSGKWQQKVTNPIPIDDVSQIIDKLKNEKWVYSKDGRQVKPHEISRFELDTNIYGQVDEKTKIYKILEFSDKEGDKIALLNKFDSIFPNEESKRLIYDHINNILHITNPPVSLPLSPPNKLIDIYKRWENLSNNKKDLLIINYEKYLYPSWFKKEDLKSDNDTAKNKAWFTLFAIAICQQLGLSSDEKNKNFLEYLKNNSWFDTMLNNTSETEWMNIIKEYYKFNTTDQKWQEWVKLISQFFIIRYFMDDYIMIIKNLDKIDPSIEFELETITKPNTNPLLNGTKIDLPALNRTLRLGLPFIIRELLRFKIIKPNKNIIYHAFMPKRRTVEIVIGENYDEGKEYTSHEIFKGINAELRKEEYTFDGYYDIPILKSDEWKI